MKIFLYLFLFCGGLSMQLNASNLGDSYKTPIGVLYIKMLGHASLMLSLNKLTIYVDPISSVCDFTDMPKADLILITHDHYDHLDSKAWQNIFQEGKTIMISAPTTLPVAKDTKFISNGQTTNYGNIKITAVPAYNIINKRPDKKPFHPKGYGNGYILDFDRFQLYIAGDTENIPEMASLKDIDIAFLPKNLPYTMSDDMFIKAVKSFSPKIVYPYHYSEVDKIALQKNIGKHSIVK